MKRIIDLYNYVNDRLRIDERGGRFTYSSFNFLVELVQNNRYDMLIDEFESSLDSTNTVGRFISVKSDTTNGVVNFPTDHYKTATIEREFNGTFRRCNIFTLEEWGARMASSIEPPTDINPMVRIIGGKLEILPAVGNIKHYYFKTLAKPYIATVVSGDEVVIDEPNSVDISITDNKSFEWMANSILTKMAVTLENAPVAQTASQNA